MRKKHIKLEIPKLESWNHIVVADDREEMTLYFNTQAGSATITMPTGEASVLGAMLIAEAHGKGRS